MTLRQEHRIILEGVDGAGKSTLKEALVSRFHYLEVIRNERANEQDFTKWWPEQLDRAPGPMVPLHDRFFYSELVYGPILRGKVNAPANLVNNVLWFLRSVSFMIYCRPPIEAIRRGLTTEKQMAGVTEHLDDLVNAYDMMMASETSWYGDRYFQYDWTRPGEFHQLEKKLEVYLERNRYQDRSSRAL